MSSNLCAVDFGTSNSAIAVCSGGRVVMAPLEGKACNLPSAIFYPEDPAEPVLIGRAALAAYTAFEEGRLLRALKSVLGSSLMQAHTEVAPGRSMSFEAILTDYLVRIRQRAEQATGMRLDKAVLGRPAFFVDDDPLRDQQAQQSLAEAAGQAGFRDIAFEFEPVAAALSFAHGESAPFLALVADIGGGTADFSVIRWRDQQRDILASHGVHVAGTDFDRRVSLDRIMPLLGLGATNANGRPVPASVYRDLATWHLVNGLYARQSRAALHEHREMYGSKQHQARLQSVLDQRLGHQLLAQAEQAKIEASEQGEHRMLLDDVERGLSQTCTREDVERVIEADLTAIAEAAQVTLRLASVQPQAIDKLFFTGGSTGLRRLRDRISAVVPQATHVEGERFESVGFGLGLAALQRWS